MLDYTIFNWTFFVMYYELDYEWELVWNAGLFFYFYITGSTWNWPVLVSRPYKLYRFWGQASNFIKTQQNKNSKNMSIYMKSQRTAPYFYILDFCLISWKIYPDIY